VSVRLPVPEWVHNSNPAAAGLLLWARRPEDVDRLLPGAQQQRLAAGKCGQCHVVSIRRKLNTDLFILLNVVTE